MDYVVADIDRIIAERDARDQRQRRRLAAVPDAKPEGPYSLPVVFFNDMQPSLVAADFVEGLLTEAAMSVVYGQSNSGKTFFMCDLALHVALGWMWGPEHDKRTTDVKGVLWLAMEGAYGISNRIAAFKRERGLEGHDIPFAVIPVSLNLLDPDADTDKLIQTMSEIAGRLGFPVGLTVVDTLARAISGGNENAPDDMGALVTNGTRIQQTIKTHLCWIHHSGKDEAKGARGHSSLRAATDTEIEITVVDGSARLASVKKQRDLDGTGEFPFALKVVELGVNQRGKPVTSCVVEFEGEHRPRGLAASTRLTGHTKRALEVLTNLVVTSGMSGFTGTPSGINSVPEKWWRERFYSDAMPGAEADTKKRAFRRAADILVEFKMVGFAGGRAWLVRQNAGQEAGHESGH